MSKTDGLGPRYKQPCGVGVHVDISTQRQEGVKSEVQSVWAQYAVMLLYYNYSGGTNTATLQTWCETDKCITKEKDKKN